MEYIQLPKFLNVWSIQGLKANVFHSPTCLYDVILETIFLQVIEMKFDYRHDVIQWLDTIAHVLPPLRKLIGTKPFVWDERKEKAFNAMKALLASNCINKYLDYTKTFHIYTDASDY